MLTVIQCVAVTILALLVGVAAVAAGVLLAMRVGLRSRGGDQAAGRPAESPPRRCREERPTILPAYLRLYAPDDDDRLEEANG